MRWVVDASVAVKWLVAEEGRPAARKLLHPAMHLNAPDLIFPEVSNALMKKVRAGEIAFEQAEEAARRFPSYLDEVRPTGALIPEALRLAQALSHAVYDCIYLACAKGDERVVTADGQFLAKARAAGHAHRIVGLNDPALA